MTDQHPSRWSLTYTGNRVALAVLIALLVGMIGALAGATGTAHVIVFVLALAVTYGVLTYVARRFF
ncbi:hypothetical protein O7598_30815 [Micromonospora sp. WMMC241]|uniref:hypothetical protein n=1 Tax=Micromonospora sp. WMMC241 TaxID=3015159 RepID=UPI0022B6D03D|nr:hypothetical protein [Micromonospora sp. WMMC241]MCZ7440816.1 hypothetical protein [Micromonospora sp. WMMC241]